MVALKNGQPSDPSDLIAPAVGFLLSVSEVLLAALGRSWNMFDPSCILKAVNGP